MNGPQHYAAAQQKIKESGEVGGAYAMLTIEQAQAHATLALAAATVAGRAIGPLEGWGGHHVELLAPGSKQWAEVLK